MANKPLNSLNLEHIIKNVVNEKLLQELGQLAVEQVRARTRLGYGAQEFGSPQQKLKPLAQSTIEKRKRKNLSPDTSPKRSNLTESGELLDSISFSTSGNKVNVFIQGERNQKIATYVSDQRPFFTISKSQVTALATVIERAIQTYLSKGS